MKNEIIHSLTKNFESFAQTYFAIQTRKVEGEKKKEVKLIIRKKK